MPNRNSTSLVSTIRQSPPLNPLLPYTTDSLRDKTILITGGSSGFGAAFSRTWASHGAHLIIGDIDTAGGESLVASLRLKTGNPNHHFIRCDVTDWESQVEFFRRAEQLSPHGGIDAVVANAGITEGSGEGIDEPVGLDAARPPRPNFRCLDVNLYGVLYTAHLALFYLARNPPSSPTTGSRDRHLLLIGSVASLMPLPGQTLYAVAKHGVMGLFRTLRATSFIKHRIRVNILCPYFIDTPLLGAAARMLLAGGGTGRADDVVDAGTRFMADEGIVGRGLAVGPRMRMDVDVDVEEEGGDEGSGGREVGVEQAVWECYADDWVKVDAFVGRFIGGVNAVEGMRGWVGWGTDIVRAVLYPVRRWVGI